MPRIGYHCSHEQFSPSEMLEYACLAEKAGFETVMSSDHFNPWSARQGQSASTWTWLGAALAQTKQVPFGSLAIPGGWRYHPAMLAQSIATLSEMFPARLEWIALGSGQNLNEHIVGCGWPDKEKRRERLLAGAKMMKQLLAGERVHDPNGVIPVDNAKLWTRPKTVPKFFAAALSESTARWAGAWADGLATINLPAEKLEAIIRAFREGGGEGKPLTIQVHVSWAESEAEARKAAHHQWRSNTLDTEESQLHPDPRDFEERTDHLKEDDLDDYVRISADLNDHSRWIDEYEKLGFDTVVLHNVGRNQKEFISACRANSLF